MYFTSFEPMKNSFSPIITLFVNTISINIFITFLHPWLVRRLLFLLSCLHLIGYFHLIGHQFFLLPSLALYFYICINPLQWPFIQLVIVKCVHQQCIRNHQSVQCVKWILWQIVAIEYRLHRPTYYRLDRMCVKVLGYKLYHTQNHT
jgi:hypothetical protein